MRIASLVCAAALAASAAPAPGPYALGRQDAFWIPASLGLGLYGQLRYRDMEPADTAALDRRKDLWAFDRWAAGMRSPAADLASNAAIAPLLALPMAVTAWESWNGRQATVTSPPCRATAPRNRARAR